MATTGNSVTVSVTGVREMLAELKKLDPELRKQTIAEMRAVTRKIAKAAKGNIPGKPPMSGWQTRPSIGGVGTNQHRVSAVPMVRGGRGWAPWGPAAKGKVKAQVGRQRKQSRRSTWTVARVVSLDAAASIFEFAGAGASSGSPVRQQFVGNLNRTGRQPGRAVWNAMDLHGAEARAAILAGLQKAEAVIQKKVG